jgi:hypothetical protein
MVPFLDETTGEEVKSMEKKTEVHTTGAEELSVKELEAQRAELLPERIQMRRRRRRRVRRRAPIFPVPKPGRHHR